jgi:transketolase
MVTAEDHSVIGGLGSAVAEVIAENNCARLKRIGLQDTFGRSGKPADLKKYFHLMPEDIEAAALELFK